MKIEIPEVPANGRTPLVVGLLARMDLLGQRSQPLEGEVAQLQGLPPRPQSAPSTLEQPSPQPQAPAQKRPGSDKRPKDALLTSHREVVLPVPEPPVGSTCKGHDDFVVGELHLCVEATR